MTIKPLCFIAMPFGRKVVDGRSVEFDTVWQEVIAPAIEGAEMQPLRADEEQVGGIGLIQLNATSSTVRQVEPAPADHLELCM